MTFSELALAEPILAALAGEHYVEPTPIQAAAIPLVLAGRDLIGVARTGTGKTAAFALPILDRLLRRGGGAPAPKTCRVLVLSPTRELSAQILDSFRTYGRNQRRSSALAIGGVSIRGQIRALAGGVDILVATPGRLMDLLNSGSIALGAVEVLVLDEADRMLDMGFIADIRRIVARLPKERQTLLFSATLSAEIARLAGEMLRDPARVSVTPPASTAVGVHQRVVHVGRERKAGLLAGLLGEAGVERAIVFTRTKHGADRVVRGLDAAGVEAVAIHGNKSQGQRERALAGFRNGSVRTLVATDIAARGLDVDSVTHVINYDLPEAPENYVHRVGRTARAGKSGMAISFCTPDDVPLLRAIEKTIGLRLAPDGGIAPAEAVPAGGADDVAVRRNDGRPPRRQPRRGRSSGPDKRPAEGRRHGGRAETGRSDSGRAEPRPAAAPVRHDGDVGAVAFLGRPRRHRRSRPAAAV